MASFSASEWLRHPDFDVAAGGVAVIRPGAPRSPSGSAPTTSEASATVLDDVVRPIEGSLPLAAQPVSEPVVKQTRIKVEKICCASEVKLVEKILAPMSGVVKLACNIMTKTAYIDHDIAQVSSQAMADALNTSNLGASVVGRAWGTPEGGDKALTAGDGAGDPQKGGDGTKPGKSPGGGDGPTDSPTKLKWHVIVGLVFWLLSMISYGDPWDTGQSEHVARRPLQFFK